MSKYFPSNTDISSTNGYRNQVKRRIDQYVRENYEASSPREGETPSSLVSGINRNSWQSRYNMNIQDEDELRSVVNEILSIVHDANTEFKQLVEDNIVENSDHRDTYDCDDVYVTVKVITTNSKGEYNGYTPLGLGSSPSDLSELNLGRFGETQYPLPALDVSVEFDY